VVRASTHNGVTGDEGDDSDASVTGIDVCEGDPFDIKLPSSPFCEGNPLAYALVFIISIQESEGAGDDAAFSMNAIME